MQLQLGRKGCQPMPELFQLIAWSLEIICVLIHVVDTYE